jgi:hypothetical protein
MRSIGSSISVVHPVFSEHESIEYPSLLDSPAELVTHCIRGAKYFLVFKTFCHSTVLA